MTENLFCSGQKRVTRSYSDGHIRTFRGYPAMNEDVKKMIRKWIRKDEPEKAALFFTEKCGLDSEYAGFLIREIYRGYL